MEGPDTVPFVVKLRRGLNLNSDLLLKPIINLDPVLQTSLKRVVVTALGFCICEQVCVFVYVFMHACEQTLLVVRLVLCRFTAKAVYFMVFNFSGVETFLYASRKLSVKK